MLKTTITTILNGTRIHTQSQELLSYIREARVLVSITEYPPTSKLRGEIINTIEQFGIIYEFRNMVENFGKNIDLTGRIDPYKA